MKRAVDEERVGHPGARYEWKTAGYSASSCGVSMGTLGMSFDPAVGAEVHSDAGGEQDERDGERADDPLEIDAALKHEEVEDAEYQDEHGSLGEEAGAASRRDDDEVEQRGGLRRGLLTCVRRRDEAKA